MLFFSSMLFDASLPGGQTIYVNTEMKIWRKTKECFFLSFYRSKKVSSSFVEDILLPRSIIQSFFLFWNICFVFTTFRTFGLALETFRRGRKKITLFFARRVYRIELWEMNDHLFPSVYTLIKGRLCCCCCCGCCCGGCCCCCGARNKYKKPKPNFRFVVYVLKRQTEREVLQVSKCQTL